MASPKPTKLMTLQQASAEFGVPYTSLRDWTIKGWLPAVRVGDTRRIWVRRDDLERLIERSIERRDAG
jgi:excisionase family DNA binding protein